MNELIAAEQTMLWGVIVVAFISLLYALWLWRDTMRHDKGTERMQEIWRTIREVAEGYRKR
jgi:K(+)-stimulated pyrophosphate-energized sodium pump